MAVIACAGPALAQTPSNTSEERLQQELQERDAIIADLVRRVEQLERALAISRAPTGERTHEPTVATRPVPPPSEAPPPPEAPGRIEVSEEDIDRALERSLVQTGALLLPSRAVELVPSFSFARREIGVPVLVIADGGTAVGEARIRRNDFVSGLAVRFGLPLDSQLELAIPYRIVDRSTVTSVGLNPLNETSGSASGIGDLTLSLSHTFLRERGGLPDIIGRVTWNTGTGKRSDDGIVLGGGFAGLGGSIVLIKRQDPLVFVGSASYATSFEDGGADPGDSFGFSLGTYLAASPETSLRFVFDQRFVDDLRFAGSRIDGSDRTTSLFTFGASTILGRGLLLDVSAGLGLTNDSPDYVLLVSLPIRIR